MPHAVRVLIVGMFYAAFGVFGLLLTFVAVPLAIMGVRDRETRIALGQDVVQRWSRRYFVWAQRFGVARPHWPRRPPAVLAQGRPAVVIANHPSLLDVVFLMGALRKHQPWHDVARRIVDFTIDELPAIEPDQLPRRGRQLVALVEADYRHSLGLDSAEASRDAAQ